MRSLKSKMRIDGELNISDRAIVLSMAIGRQATDRQMHYLWPYARPDRSRWRHPSAALERLA